jgi:ribosome-associated protein
MGRKAPKGYYVDGEFVVRESAEEAALGGDSPSRTARKKASEELQRIGEGLLSQRAGALDELHLPEKLRDAIAEAQRLDNFGAKRRQLQFIGKLMRGLEPEVLEAVQAALAKGQPSRGRGPRG